MLRWKKKLREMESRLAETQQRLASEQSSSQKFWNVLNNKEGPVLEAAQKDLTIMFLKNQTEELMKKLQEQADMIQKRFQDMDNKIETVAKQGPVGGQVVRNTGMSYKEIQEKMEEIQKKLFDPDIEERESEALNIEYEKLVTELESTKEYQAEQAAVIQQWKDENIPLNKAALEKIRSELASFPPMKKNSCTETKARVEIS